MSVYYNENDPFAAEWLRQLIKAGHIAPGDVDERSIVDVTPVDLKPYHQCHFFAGVGVWSYALRRAGWPDDKPVWSGSCPCQPFSAAGKRKGTRDDRDLWWAFFWLISQCRPETIFGEQVASKDGLAWWDTVQTDLEGAGYAAAAFDLCAAGVGAPHIRQRLYWVADGSQQGLEKFSVQPAWTERQAAERGGEAIKLANADGGERRRLADGEGCEHNGAQARRQQGDSEPAASGIVLELADAAHVGHERAGASRNWWTRPADNGNHDWPGPTNGHWRDADWLYCRDGRWRPVEPGTFPLAHGAAARVGRLRGYGNAIVAPLAQAFIEAYLGN